MNEAPRRGSDLLIETLCALGATTVFGIPGQHALGMFDSLQASPLELISSRVENNAAFAADGYARATGEVGILFLSTGPGALTALAGLQEAYSSSVPLIVIVSQIPTVGLGGVRKGMLHQLDDQQLAAVNVTKGTRVIRHTGQIPSAIEEAWSLATSAPSGPVWIEVPQDILLETTSAPPVVDVSAVTRNLKPRAELISEAARLLNQSERPVILAGGGCRRANAGKELLDVAELLQAPVVSTVGGKGVFPWHHDLSAQSWIEDRYTTELLENADVLIAIGTSLGELTSNYFTLAPQGHLIQIDAEVRVLESNHAGLAIHADAKEALKSLRELIEQGNRPESYPTTSQLLDDVRRRLDSQDLDNERKLLNGIRSAIPSDSQTFWDMTIAAYWAWSAWDAKDGEFHSAQGAGGLGFAFPAAIGAALGIGRRVLAVSGDGGAMYSLSELASARQHDAPVTWLIVDDGGYGILREYMNEEFGRATATELSRPDFVALAESFKVPAYQATIETLPAVLASAWAEDGPNVVVISAVLAMFEPTHLT